MDSMENITGKLYELWRQDDNGNRFLIAVYDDRDSADKRLAGLAGNPHKQMYWITELPERSSGN